MLLAAVLVVSVAALAGVVRLGGAAVDRARADAVADLVVLAGASAGPGGAEEVSRSNGAEIVSMEARGDVTVVVVRYDKVLAVAAARLEPG